MSRRRQRINPMMDIAAKKVFSDSEVTTEFIEAFLGFRPQKVTILNGTVADLKIEQEGYFSTTVDVLASLEDDTQVIIEIQVAHQQGFLKRLWIYICQHLVKNLPNVRQKVAKTHEMYDKIQPVYGIALVGSNYFDDKRPVRSFVISDSETGQALKLSFDNSKQVRTPFEIVIVELKKLGHGKINTKQQLWMEFFANRKFSQKQTRAIQKAEYLLNIKNWTREEQEMIHTWNRNAANYFETMQIKYEEGQEEGIKKGIELKTQEILLAMFQAGNSDENIALVLNIPIEEVISLRKKSSLNESAE